MKFNFQTAKNSVKQDISSGKYEDLLGIIEESDTAITVYDDIDGFSREYTLTDPEVIDTDWINSKIIITPSVSKTGYKPNQRKIAEWLVAHIDKTMYLNLENIIIVNDTEKDFDYLSNLSETLSCRLECSSLPDKNLIGLMWHCYQTVLVNIGTIVTTTEEMIEEGLLYKLEKDHTINEGLLATLAHEIRHLAQANPYLPEEILNQQNNDEEDAENFAHQICDKGTPCVLDKTAP